MLGFALAAALALVPGLELWRFAVSSLALPQWDMAKYGASSLRLADAMRQGDVLGWLGAVHGLATWPPTWPLAESVVFLVFGDGFEVARGFVVVTWMLAVVTAYWALRPLPNGDVAGLLAAAWVAQSPLLQSLATVHLLEVPGTFLLLVCLGCGLRALGPKDSRDQGRWWRATWLASLLLFFLKYNYGLLWLAPLYLAESVRRQGGWNALARSGWLRLRALRWTPWTVFVAVYVVLLAAIRLSGGIDTEILGRHLRATSIGNPAYALLILVCLRQLVAGPGAWRRLRRRWRSLDHAWYGVGSWLVVPILLWMLLPPHVKDFFGFVENRDSGLGLVDGIAFYPRMLLQEFSRAWWIGALVLVLALASLPWLRAGARRPRRLLLVLCALVACLAVVLHPYKLVRFGVHAAVLVGALAAVRLASSPRRGDAPVMRALAVVAALFSVAVGIDSATVAEQHRLRTVPAVAHDTVMAAAQVAVSGGIVLGIRNELSPGLLEWTARREHTLAAAWRPATTFDLTRRSNAEAVIGALAESPCRPVALVASGESWLESVEASLRADPCREASSPQRWLTIFACPQGVESETCRSR